MSAIQLSWAEVQGTAATIFQSAGAATAAAVGAATKKGVANAAGIGTATVSNPIPLEADAAGTSTGAGTGSFNIEEAITPWFPMVSDPEIWTPKQGHF